MYSLQKYLLRSFAHFIIRLSIHGLLLSCMSSLYILCIKPLIDTLFSNIFSHYVCVCVRCLVRLQPWTVVFQVDCPLFMVFSRQEYWSGESFPFLGVFPTQDQTQVSCIAGRFFTVRLCRLFSFFILIIVSFAMQKCFSSM